MQQLIPAFRNALEQLDRAGAEAVFARVLRASSPLATAEQLVVSALEQIGTAWERGEASLSQVYMSGRLCEQLVERVLPASDPERKRQPRSAIVTLCDNHELGRRIVYSMLRASGFEVFDYGSMQVDELADRACRDELRILLVSTLMLPSALRVGALCRKLREQTDSIRVVVGGAPFQLAPDLWREVGADAVGYNAGDAVRIMMQMMGEPS